MSLRAQAEADLAATLEAPGDFGWALTLTDPAGLTNAAPLYGQSGDIGIVLDPNTGMAVSGRLAHVSVRIEALIGAGFVGLPVGISDPASKPWLAAFDDINGASKLFKVRHSFPDRTLGIVTMTLEFYEVA